MAGPSRSVGVILWLFACVASSAAEGTGMMVGCRTEPLDESAWEQSVWLSVPDAPVVDGEVTGTTRAAAGTSWFVGRFVNSNQVSSVRWMTAGLGVYELYVNGRRIGNDFLKPGFTHNGKTKYAFTYDVTAAAELFSGGTNVFSAEVSAAWWRDKVCSPSVVRGGFFGRKSAFRSVVEVTWTSGKRCLFGTSPETWRAGIGGPVLAASIFDGEEYDARRLPLFLCESALGSSERNAEFRGRILPTAGAEVGLRWDLMLRPISAYVWQRIEGGGREVFGRVVKLREYSSDGTMLINPGETLVVDFGQNAAAVPFFRFRAKSGTALKILPGEMLNDCGGLKSRGNDGPEGSVYRANLREGREDGRLVRYVFAGEGEETYMTRFSYFGYRYLSMTVTAPVEIREIGSVPVSSIRREMEAGELETGDASLNQFIRNVRWGMISNYLSVPTDCPQRDERLGWMADAQVFAEAATFHADVLDFLRKWLHDVRDSQHSNGGYASVAPYAQYCNHSMRVGWADAGVIVPYVLYCQYGDTRVIEENWEAMSRFLCRVEQTKYAFAAIGEDCQGGQYADWLSLEDYESCGGGAYFTNSDGTRVPRMAAVRYWNFLGGCYWLMDSQMMAKMAAATGRRSEFDRWTLSARRARDYLRREFIDSADGLLSVGIRHLQGAMLFAMHCRLFDDVLAMERTKSAYRQSLANHGGCNQTGFLGTSILMETLTENGMNDIAYDLLLNHGFPSWLYSVDQGATTVWERWNGYTEEGGFGPASMNSFNHYAYGAVLSWIYRHAAGIACDPQNAGFKTIVMAPVPDRRLGYVRASYRSAAGLVKSEWRYEGEKWIWDYVVPDGATALVILPDETIAQRVESGVHHVEVSLPVCSVGGTSDVGRSGFDSAKW